MENICCPSRSHKMQIPLHFEVGNFSRRGDKQSRDFFYRWDLEMSKNEKKIK